MQSNPENQTGVKQHLATKLSSDTASGATSSAPAIDWQVQEGAMVGGKLDPEQVVSYLQQLNVVAEIDWFAATPHLMGINILRDQADGLAALDQPNGQFRLGAVLSELVEKLADRFAADVRIGQYHHSCLPAETVLPTPASKADTKVRVVEITDMPVSAVPFCAAANDLTIGSLALGSGKRALFYETTEDQIVDGSLVSQIPALGLYVSPLDQRILAVTSQESADPEALAIHSWTMKTQVVAGKVKNPDQVLIAAIRDFLGHGDTPARIAQYSGADPEELKAAFEIEGQPGMLRALMALGLPSSGAAYLFGNLDLDQIDAVELFHQPGWAKAIGSSVNLRINYSQSPGAQPLKSLGQIAIKHPGLLRTLNLVEGVVALSLIGTGVFSRIFNKRLANLSLASGSLMLLDAGIRFSLGRIVGGSTSPESKK